MDREEYLGFYNINHTKRGGIAKELCQCTQEDKKELEYIIFKQSNPDSDFFFSYMWILVFNC